MKRPLDGLLVVSLEQAVAAPFATRQLADWGARVIKVERAEGDFARRYDETVRGLSSYFAWLNRGKESIVLDLKSPDGSSALRSLIGRADVLVQNLAPGAIERMGFGATAAMDLNPRLIHVSISGYGPGGPLSDKKAYDLLIQCEAGLLDVTGTPAEHVKAGISIADIAAGMYAYSGTLLALLNRASSGVGDAISVSMLEALGEWMSQPYLFAEYSGNSPARTGASHASIAPYGPFEGLDGRVFFGVQNEREWTEFCSRVIKSSTVATDVRFSSNVARVAHRHELQVAIDREFSSLAVEEIVRRLDAAGIANARLRTMHEFSGHPQLAARHRWTDVPTPVGEVRMLRPPVDSAAAEASMRPVPAIGEHTDAILREIGSW